ncbi:unnamed protein product [Peniophora sp. CBMAI 1063]|nr:unnamed protein product [Peniophora sp. CBMAI 1063]
MSAEGSSVPTAAKLLAAHSRNDGAQAGPVVRRSTFYLYIVLSVLVLLLAFAGWGTYMIRIRRYVEHLRRLDTNDRTVSAEKLERPTWLNVHVRCEETSAREAVPVSAFIMDDPPSVAFPLHRLRLLPAVHAQPTIIARSSKAKLQLAYLIAMPLKSTASSSPPLIELGVRRSTGRLVA